MWSRSFWGFTAFTVYVYKFYNEHYSSLYVHIHDASLAMHDASLSAKLLQHSPSRWHERRQSWWTSMLDLSGWNFLTIWRFPQWRYRDTSFTFIYPIYCWLYFGKSGEHGWFGVPNQVLNPLPHLCPVPSPGRNAQEVFATEPSADGIFVAPGDMASGGSTVPYHAVSLFIFGFLQCSYLDTKGLWAKWLQKCTSCAQFYEATCNLCNKTVLEWYTQQNVPWNVINHGWLWNPQTKLGDFPLPVSNRSRLVAPKKTKHYG